MVHLTGADPHLMFGTGAAADKVCTYFMGTVVPVIESKMRRFVEERE